MIFLQFDFETHSKDENEQLIALLSEQGFDGFEEDEDTLIAFIPKRVFDEGAFQKTLERFAILSYTKTAVENINWNKKWEEEFEPVIVDKFVGIRAHFHKAIKNVQHEIIITPKMSFGTGHHATTYMMIQQMKGLDFKEKKVFDFGTGTGVLAILAEKLGAAQVLAIDNDEWSITNAKENCASNGCSTVSIRQMDKVPKTGQYDIILANINLNVITATLPALAAIATPAARLILSGFLKTDQPVLLKALGKAGLHQITTIQRGDWIAVLCEK